jgi:hypothetical protein
MVLKKQEVVSLFKWPASLKISGDFPVRLLSMAKMGVNKRRISG